MLWKLMELIPILVVAGCVSAGNQAAICDGSQAARTALAAALAQDGGDLSVASGARLIRLLDAGCNDV